MLLLPKSKKTILSWAIAVVLPAIVILPVACCTTFGLSNSFLIPGVVYVAGVVLVWVTRCGVFDTFAFQFSNFLYSWLRHSPKKYDNLPQYKEIKGEKRRLNPAPYLPFAIIGALLVILAIIFAFVKI